MERGCRLMSRCVFVTGATGAIGSALVPVLLEDPGTRVILLIRARDDGHLRARLLALARFWGIDPDALEMSGRVQALCGDVVEPCFGLNEGTYRSVAASVTHVVHAAGNVRLDLPLEDARRHATVGAGHVLELASRAAQHGRFEKLEYLSTVGVAGCTPGLLRECPQDGVRRFHNSYEQAKAEAETHVLAANDEFPVTVHRPSMVVGDSRTGKIIAFQVFYHLAELLTGRKTAGFIPDAGDARLDLVPVDFVSRIIAASMRRPDARGRIFHICGGPEQSPGLLDLAIAIREFFARDGEVLPPLRLPPLAVFHSIMTIARCLSFGRTRRRLASLPRFLAYLNELQSYDTRQTQAFFASDALRVPNAMSYLEIVLKYYRERLVQKLCRGVS
jgi:thioester reductase-like protein